MSLGYCLHDVKQCEPTDCESDSDRGFIWGGGEDRRSGNGHRDAETDKETERGAERNRATETEWIECLSIYTH